MALATTEKPERTATEALLIIGGGDAGISAALQPGTSILRPGSASSSPTASLTTGRISRRGKGSGRRSLRQLCYGDEHPKRMHSAVVVAPSVSAPRFPTPSEAT